MIQLTIQGGGLTQKLDRMVEKLNNPSQFLEDVGAVILESIFTNFSVGGRPSWTPTKKGNKPLVGTGTLMNTYSVERTPTSIHIVWGGGLPYAHIHNSGGSIPHPGSSKKQAFIGSRDGKLVVTDYTRPHAIPMPQRKFVMFQQQDIDKITQMWNEYITD